MLYNEFIKAGVTLEEIELMNHYAGLVNLELGEHNGELCFIDSKTEIVNITGLNKMIGLVKTINNKLIETNTDKESANKLKYNSKIILAIESKAQFTDKNVA